MYDSKFARFRTNPTWIFNFHDETLFSLHPSSSFSICNSAKNSSKTGLFQVFWRVLLVCFLLISQQVFWMTSISLRHIKKSHFYQSANVGCHDDVFQKVFLRTEFENRACSHHIPSKIRVLHWNQVQKYPLVCERGKSHEFFFNYILPAESIVFHWELMRACLAKRHFLGVSKLCGDLEPCMLPLRSSVSFTSV